MLDWFIHLLVDAFIILMAPQFLSGVKIKDFVTAFIVAIAISVLSFFAMPILGRLFNIATLGIPYVLGLGFLLRLLASSIIIEIVDQFSTGFSTKGFLPSFYLAVILSIAGTVVSYIL